MSSQLAGSEDSVTLLLRGTGALTFPVGFQFQDWNERGKLVKKAHFPFKKHEWWRGEIGGAKGRGKGWKKKKEQKRGKVVYHCVYAAIAFMWNWFSVRDTYIKELENIKKYSV